MIYSMFWVGEKTFLYLYFFWTKFNNISSIVIVIQLVEVRCPLCYYFTTFFSHLYFRSHLINYNDLYEFTLRFVSNFCVYNKNQDNCENVVKKYNQDHHIHYLLIKNNFHRACLLSYDDIFVKYFPRATYETSISLPRQ